MLYSFPLYCDLSASMARVISSFVIYVSPKRRLSWNWAPTTSFGIPSLIPASSPKEYSTPMYRRQREALPLTSIPEWKSPSPMSISHCRYIPYCTDSGCILSNRKPTRNASPPCTYIQKHFRSSSRIGSLHLKEPLNEAQRPFSLRCSFIGKDEHGAVQGDAVFWKMLQGSCLQIFTCENCFFCIP